MSTFHWGSWLELSAMATKRIVNQAYKPQIAVYLQDLSSVYLQRCLNAGQFPMSILKCLICSASIHKFRIDLKAKSKYRKLWLCFLGGYFTQFYFLLLLSIFCISTCFGCRCLHVKFFRLSMCVCDMSWIICKYLWYVVFCVNVCGVCILLLFHVLSMWLYWTDPWW